MITQRNNPAIASVLSDFIIKGGTRTLETEIEKKAHLIPKEGWKF